MAGKQTQPLVFQGLRGRDGSTSSVSQIPVDKALEMLNVDLFRAGFARKRGGATAFSLSGSGLTGRVSAAFRHVPGADDTAAELWLVCSNGIWARYASGVWSNPAIVDALTGNAWDVQAASLYGKLYFAYKSAFDRLHCWDPNSSSIRRTGLAVVTGFTSADLSDTGAGTSTQRWYRVRVTEQRSGSTVRRSEPTAAVAYTPAAADVRFTFAGLTAPGEGETHWEIEAAANSINGPWFVLTTVAIGTATYDDESDPVTYSSLTAAPLSGAYINWTSVKYLTTDDNRLIGAGAHESGNPVNTVYTSPVIGTTSSAFFDDEYVPTSTPHRLEFNERDSGFIVGFGLPYDNQVIVLKDRQTWRMIGTGSTDAPYRRKPVSRIVGALNQKSIVLAEDEAGNPALYWLSQQGPYRFAQSGMARLVEDIRDLWSTVNRAATTTVAHGVYHADIHQIWWWIAVGSENEPTTTLIKYDTKIGRVIEAGEVREGWTVADGEIAKARCSVVFSATIGTTTSRDLKPYIGQHGAVTRFWQCDTSALTDNGTAFRGLVTLPDRHVGGLSRRCALGHPTVLGSAGSYDIEVTQRRNYGTSDPMIRAASVTMDAIEGDETRVLKTVEGVETSDEAYAVGLSVGDAFAIASPQWVLDAVIQPFEQREAIPA